MKENVKVRLKIDLTKYLTGLVAGSEGITIGRYGEWSRNYDHFIGVNFPNIGKLDVAIDGLEIIDDDYLKELETSKIKKLEELKTATDIKLSLGSQGGFRYLSYEYSGGFCGNGFKKESLELVEYFKSIGLPVRTTYAVK